MSKSKNEADDFLQRLDRFQKNKPKLLTELAAREGAVIVAEIQGRTPEETGLLRESWHSDTFISFNTEKSATVWITNNVEYGPHLEYGHRIVDKNGKTIGYAKGFFMLRSGIRYYIDNLKDKNEQKFWDEKIREYFDF